MVSRGFTNTYTDLVDLLSLLTLPCRLPMSQCTQDRIHNNYYEEDREAYFLNLISSAAPATLLTSLLAIVRFNGANVSEEVKSHNNDHPSSHGMRVMPSGLLAHTPTDFIIDSTPPDTKAG